MTSIDEVVDFLRDHQDDSSIIMAVIDEITFNIESRRKKNSALNRHVRKEIDTYKQLVADHNKLVSSCGYYANKKQDIASENEKLKQRKNVLRIQYKKGKKCSKSLKRSVDALDSQVKAIEMTIEEFKKIADDKRCTLLELSHQLEQTRDSIKDGEGEIEDTIEKLSIHKPRTRPVKIFHVRTGMPKISERYTANVRDSPVQFEKQTARLAPLRCSSSTLSLHTHTDKTPHPTSMLHPFAIRNGTKVE